jgi:peptidoglycan/xylan/chitin deacetylase (PgdA/CDA1 family)
MLYRGSPKYHEVALTIDDGPHALYGPEILDLLTKYHIRATFFVVGIRVKQEPEQVREMVALGNEIGNHTFDHQRLNKLTSREVENEIKSDDDCIYRAAGVHPIVMRPPGEQFNEGVLQIAKKMGYVTVDWTNAAKDYEVQTPDYIVRRVVDSTDNGSIILLHQDSPATALALPRIITALKKRGYRFVTISTMLAHLGVQPYADQEKQALEQKPNASPILANGHIVDEESFSATKTAQDMGAVSFTPKRTPRRAE